MMGKLKNEDKDDCKDKSCNDGANNPFVPSDPLWHGS